MSKRGFISRYLLIIKKLKAKPFSTFEELQAYIDNQSEYLRMQDDTLSIDISIRTFQRDKKEIRDLFGIDIQYSKKNKGYYIFQSENENMNFQRMLEAFDIFNSLNIAKDLTPFIHLENRKPQGTENLYGLLHAIKNKLQIKFSYQKFWEDSITQRLTEPYALKEFRSRWYLMAKDSKDGNVKCFALDRLSNLEITNIKYQYPNEFNVEKTFRYSFGIISPTNEQPKEIILSFNPIQGKYVKTLPLHHTQEVLIDNKTEMKIKLKLCLTHDLLMELLSFGNNMKVIEPKSLAIEIKEAHENAFNQY